MSSPQQSQSANLGILLYAIGITIGGIVLIVLGAVLDWGFMAYMGGGLLVVAGASMLIGRMRGGLTFLQLTCPECSHEQTYAEEAFDHGRVAPCRGCFLYLQRVNGEMVAVPRDRVANEPIFEAPMPSSLHFHDGCCLCGQPATGTETIEGSVLRSIPGVATKKITRTLEVPICEAHRGQHAVTLGPATYLPGHEGFTLGFRSYAACLAFRHANPTELAVQGALTFGRGSAPASA